MRCKSAAHPGISPANAAGETWTAGQGRGQIQMLLDNFSLIEESATTESSLFANTCLNEERSPALHLSFFSRLPVA